MAKKVENNDITYSDGLKRSLAPDVIKKVRKELGSKVSSTVGNNILDIAAGFIPVLGLVKSKTSFQGYYDYRTAIKLLNFMEAFSQEDLDPTKFEEMIQEVESINKESLFETMMDIIDRIDNVNKTVILANILRHSIKGDISRPNYLRHCWILTNIPYIDLLQLHKYTTDYYETASSEILMSNGLIRETIIDAGEFGTEEENKGGSKFGLSSLGEEMLYYGLCFSDWQYTGKGRTIPGLGWVEIE